MTPWLQDPDVTLHHGDALEVLRELPDESVHMCATSPPFYGLRDYGVEGQIGLEDSPDEWAARLLEVFREARRVLRKDGSLWIECGDSYNSATSASRVGSTVEGLHGYWANPQIKHRVNARDLKPKDLLGQPFLLAFALRADGWYWRGCYPWHKPNAMPESVRDRCTTAHSYVLHFAKSKRYYFDPEAISEPAEWARWGDQTTPKYEGTETSSGWMQPRSKAELLAMAEGRGKQGETAAAAAAAAAGNDASARRYDGFNERWKASGRKGNGQKPRTDERRGFDEREDRADGRKNPRSVWTIPTAGYPEAHFATWPEALARRIILAGCPENGTVLDPFVGSGTTCLVARKLGRHAIGIDLNESYLKLAARRLQQQSLFAEAM